MLFTGICLVTLTWVVVFGICMTLIDIRHQEKMAKINRLYGFAVKNNLDPKALRELYDICLDK